ncbi:BRO family protein [Treponema sp. OMZ 788]|uniref:BRO family protein n=1 Tax=Treponema sp. OMZ 788 TaxID=2563664 RepID=UPI0020A46513|nr:BRO family protein [Treponema sp. OMZ 788]
MTIKEIAELCGVDDTTILRWTRNISDCKMQSDIKSKLKKSGHGIASDFSLEETLAIIGDGGGNKTLAAMLEENHALEAKKALKTHENSLLPLSFNGFTVRTLTINNEQWWIAKDVCDVLDIKNPRDAISFLDDDERGSVGISDGTSPKGGNPNMNIINESGLYTLILRSNKPEAKKFRKWVTSEVLPSIRKNGAYDVTGAFNDRLERMEKALEDLAEFKSTILKITSEPKVVEYRTINSQLDEDIYIFYKKHVDDSVPTAVYTKAIDVWDLFKYDTHAKYPKAEFLERFRAIYPQFTFEKNKNIDVFWGFRLVDTCGVC